MQYYLDSIQYLQLVEVVADVIVKVVKVDGPRDGNADGTTGWRLRRLRRITRHRGVVVVVRLPGHRRVCKLLAHRRFLGDGVLLVVVLGREIASAVVPRAACSSVPVLQVVVKLHVDLRFQVRVVEQIVACPLLRPLTGNVAGAPPVVRDVLGRCDVVACVDDALLDDFRLASVFDGEVGFVRDGHDALFVRLLRRAAKPAIDRLRKVRLPRRKRNDWLAAVLHPFVWAEVVVHPQPFAVRDADLVEEVVEHLGHQAGLHPSVVLASAVGGVADLRQRGVLSGASFPAENHERRQQTAFNVVGVVGVLLGVSNEGGRDNNCQTALRWVPSCGRPPVAVEHGAFRVWHHEDRNFVEIHNDQCAFHVLDFVAHMLDATDGASLRVFRKLALVARLSQRQIGGLAESLNCALHGLDRLLLAAVAVFDQPGDDHCKRRLACA
mmetsp:Transcript_23546/g.72935  ORF Transcript_23546/g.72935 Transcript_23546/m.72935 type:complete len:438 (-) Transcript_23546:889-2202(-)